MLARQVLKLHQNGCIRANLQIYHLRVVVPSRVPAVSPQVPVHVDVEAVVAVRSVKDGTAQTQGDGLGRLAELDLAADATWIISNYYIFIVSCKGSICIVSKILR